MLTVKVSVEKSLSSHPTLRNLSICDVFAPRLRGLQVAHLFHENFTVLLGLLKWNWVTNHFNDALIEFWW